MYPRTGTVENITKSLPYIQQLSPETYFTFSYDGSLFIEAKSNKELRTLRSIFGRVLWKKEYVEYAEHWAYTGTTKTGLQIRISGVKDAPARCRAVTETVTETVEVPTGYRKEQREVTRTRYICPGDSKKSE